MNQNHSTVLHLASEAVRQRDWVSAETHAIAALREEPLSADANRVLGTVCCQTGRTDAAIAYLERSVELQPCATWLNNLGVVYAAADRWHDAARVFEQSVDLRSDDVTTLGHYGRALCEVRQFRHARTVLERVGAEELGADGALIDLGWALLETDEPEQAYEALHRAMASVTDPGRCLHLLLRVCRALHKLTERVEHARALAAAQPSAGSLTELALALWESGNLTEALRTAEQAFSYGVTSPDLHSGLLYLMLFDPAQSGRSLAEAHLSWAVTHCRTEVHCPRQSLPPRQGRKLRIGYVAANLFTSPARYTRLPLIAHADCDRFDIHVYGTQPPSTRDEHLHSTLPGIYRNVHNLSDEELLRLIRNDHLDVMVDLIGHHSFGRLRVFGKRAAPVQIAYGTYPGTTGLRELDYLLTDESTSPLGTEEEYAERLWRVKSGYLMYEPPPNSLKPSEFPAQINGHITFGVFQREAKLNAPYYGALSRILQATPGSRLLLHHESPSFDNLHEERPERILSELGARGIAEDRLRFVGGRSIEKHMSVLSEADIALDTFPYNGHTITCECLWMGVPVVVLSADRHAGRVGAGLLRQANLDAWVARSVDEYVRIAASRARDLAALGRLRAGLREQVASSTLVDTKTRTRAIENVLQAVCRGEAPSGAGPGCLPY